MTAVPFFIYSRPLQAGEFDGRKREVRRVVGRVRTQQNTLVVGSPHMGKTSFLNYLESELAREAWGAGYERLLFRHLDVQTLLGLQTQAAFWKQVLDWPPLFRALDDLCPVYDQVEKNEFGTFMLELLFKALHSQGYQLILMLDEFDTFLSHPILNNAEFYGSLRSLSSRFPSLTLLLASRLPISKLNRETQAFAPHGSPYFNVFTEYELGPLAQVDVGRLLAETGFERDQRRFVDELGGHHPFLTQLTAAFLAEAEEDGHRGDKLYRQAADAIHRQARQHYEDCWQLWTGDDRKALTAVALSQMPYLIPGQTANVHDLRRSLDEYIPELERLQPSGIVTHHEQNGWRIRQHLFVWWLADDLVRRLRNKELTFDDWLQQQMLDGVLTYREKELFGQAAKAVGEIIGAGARTFIEAYAQGLAGK